MKWFAANRYNVIDMLGVYVIGKLATEFGIFALAYLPVFMALSYAAEKATRVK